MIYCILFYYITLYYIQKNNIVVCFTILDLIYDMILYCIIIII